MARVPEVLVVDQDPLPILAACPVDVLQFHGSESPEQVARVRVRAYKAFRVRGLERRRPAGGSVAMLAPLAPLTHRARPRRCP